MFEQFRKNIKLNKTISNNKDISPSEKHAMLTQKKKEFYSGLLKDLIEQKAYAIA